MKVSLLSGGGGDKCLWRRMATATVLRKNTIGVNLTRFFSSGFLAGGGCIIFGNEDLELRMPLLLFVNPPRIQFPERAEDGMRLVPDNMTHLKL